MIIESCILKPNVLIEIIVRQLNHFIAPPSPIQINRVKSLLNNGGAHIRANKSLQQHSHTPLDASTPRTKLNEREFWARA